METKTKKFPSILSSFWLKIIGIVTMLFDHFGRIAYMDYLGNVGGRSNSWFNYGYFNTFTIIGRIAFPIFAFLIVEGMIHTKKPLLYLLRLFILTEVINVGYGLFTLISTGSYEFMVMSSTLDNPIIILFIGALTIYFLKDQRIWFKLFALIPITFTLLCSFDIIPFNLSYSLYGLILIILFYLSIPLSKLFIKLYASMSGLDKEMLEDNYLFLARKLISALLMIIFSILIVFTNPIWNGHNFFVGDAPKQLWAMFSLIPIILYSGERGYSAKWFKYGNYLFFPLHIVILFILFYLI